MKCRGSEHYTLKLWNLGMLSILNQKTLEGPQRQGLSDLPSSCLLPLSLSSKNSYKPKFLSPKVDLRHLNSSSQSKSVKPREVTLWPSPFSLKTPMWQVSWPVPRGKECAERGQEASKQTGLAGFPSQSIIIRSYSFFPITVLHSCPFFTEPKHRNRQFSLGL